MLLSEDKMQPLITRGQLVLLNNELAKDARAWTNVFVRHAGCVDLGTRNKVYREVLAFASRLAEIKFKEAGLQPEVSMAELPRRSRVLEAARRQANDLMVHLLPGSVSEPETFANFLALYCQKNQDAPDFTEAMFAEFCMATGLETKVLVGSGVNLACLVFYFVVFGLLGFDVNSTRAERNLVLKDARLCQEHFNRLIDKFIAGPGKFASLLPLLGLRQSEILMLVGPRRRRLLAKRASSIS